MSSVFFRRTYDEAFGLLVEARDYLAYKEPIDRQAIEVGDRLAVNCEAMRLTSRLTQIMAWLLVQRAVVAGELTPREAAEDRHRLAGQSVCRARSAAANTRIPPSLQSLLDRSYSLYTRVERLDEMAASRSH